MRQLSQLLKLCSSDRFNLITILVIATCIRIPLYHTVYWRTNDAIEYINLARNLASGAGFTQNYKFNYSTTDPVITSSFHGRTSLFSLFLAGILYIGGNEYTMQIFCLGIGIINALLIYILCRKWVSPVWSLVAGMLAALNPNLLINNRLILTEPLFTMFILLTFVIFYFMKERYLKYCLMGCFTALAYLTRTEGILLLPLLTITSVKPHKRILKTILLVGTFIVISFPYFYGNFVINGNPLYSIHERLYAVRDYREYVNGNGYAMTFSSPITFIENNFFWVIHKEILVFRDNINSMSNIDYFGPFVVFILIIYAITFWKKFANFYIYAIIIVLVYTSAWSALFERSRHFTASFLLLLIPLAFFFEKLAKKSKKTVIIILLSVLLPYILLDIHRIIFAKKIDTLAVERWGPKLRRKEFAWFEKNTDKNDIISSTNPEMVYLFTDHPGIITPNALKKSNYSSFIQQYHVKYFLIDNPKGDILLKQVAILKAKLPHSTIYQVRG